MKFLLVLMATAACLRATASPVCPMGDFYPASDVRGSIDSALADPKPDVVHDDELMWFDFIEIGVQFEPNGQRIYEVAVLRGSNGAFRVGLLRPKAGTGDDFPRPGVADSRDLPPALAERLHRAAIPILARTHYPADLVQMVPRFECMTGTHRLYATVANIDGWFHSLTGEARPFVRGMKDSDVGSVQALGQALRDYALRRIDADGLEEPLELVEARAKPDKGKER